MRIFTRYQSKLNVFSYRRIDGRWGGKIANPEIAVFECLPA